MADRVVKLTAAPPEVALPPGPSRPWPAHLSRYPGDTSHLKAFTQTAQVPQVAAGPPVHPPCPPGLRFDTTDAIPVTSRVPPAQPGPVALRVAVWSTVLLLVLGVAGVAVHHWRPAWLAKIHLVPSASGPPGTHGATPAPRPRAGRHRW